MSDSTRRELYEKIWSAPMREVAKEYGISDVYLKRRCVHLKIPIPPRGYWNLKPARRPKPLPLLKAERAEADVVIKPYNRTPLRRPDFRNALLASRAEFEHLKTQAAADTNASPAARVEAIIDILTREFDRMKLRPRIGVERYGLEVSVGPNPPITVRVFEVHKHIIVKTIGRPPSWIGARNPPTEKIIATGRLRITVGGGEGTEGLRWQFNDNARKQVESKLSYVLENVRARIRIHPVAEAEKTQLRLTRQREEDESERLRMAKRRDESAWKLFCELSERWNRVVPVARFLEALSNAPANVKDEMVGDKSIADWEIWARAWIDRQNPLSPGPKPLWCKIAKAMETTPYYW